MPERGRHPAFWQSAERSEKTTYSCLGKHLGLAARWIADDTIHVDGGSAVQLHRNRNHFCEGTKRADRPHGGSFTFK